ncbi:hypothetical protein FPQ18DRAFT_343266 [Pyronema domesticum]|nr:hypothetical protein FPQ18DRAFT_343266 [Pyronema domesticum]
MNSRFSSSSSFRIPLRVLFPMALIIPSTCSSVSRADRCRFGESIMAEFGGFKNWSVLLRVICSITWLIIANF